MVWITVDLADAYSLVCFFLLGMVQIKHLFLILGGGGALCLPDDWLIQTLRLVTKQTLAGTKLVVFCGDWRFYSWRVVKFANNPFFLLAFPGPTPPPPANLE